VRVGIQFVVAAPRSETTTCGEAGRTGAEPGRSPSLLRRLAAICRHARPAAYRQANNIAAILPAPTLRFAHGRSA